MQLWLPGCPWYKLAVDLGHLQTVLSVWLWEGTVQRRGNFQIWLWHVTRRFGRWWNWGPRRLGLLAAARAPGHAPYGAGRFGRCTACWGQLPEVWASLVGAAHPDVPRSRRARWETLPTSVGSRTVMQNLGHNSRTLGLDKNVNFKVHCIWISRFKFGFQEHNLTGDLCHLAKTPGKLVVKE